MKKFVFKYAPLLKKREHLENEIKLQLAEVYTKRNVISAKLDALEVQMVGLYRQLESPGLRQIAELKFFDFSIRQITDARIELEAKLEQLGKEELIIKEKLAIAHREKRMLEVLREKKLEVYEEEARKEEMKLLDEIAVTRTLMNAP